MSMLTVLKGQVRSLGKHLRAIQKTVDSLNKEKTAIGGPFGRGPGNKISAIGAARARRSKKTKASKSRKGKR